MLKRLQFENFKSWHTADIEFAPITAFFGANSSGKSSILQFLLMLKQTKDSPDRNLALDFGGDDSLVDLGSFQAAIYRHNEAEQIKWTLDWIARDELKISDPSDKRQSILFRGKDISISSAVGLRNKAVVGELLAYNFDGSSFELKRDPNRAEFHLTSEGTNFRFTRVPGRVWTLPAPTKSYAFPDQARTYYQNSQFLSEFETAYVQQMDDILHLGPLRDFPKRQYIWAGSSPVDVGRRGERTIDAILAATIRGEKRNVRPKSPLRPFQEMIAWWLKTMGLISGFEVKEVAEGSGLFRAFVRRDSKSAETLITDVGFGISQILPALVLLYYAPEGSTVILEQPEIHLHPAVQAAFADVLVAVSKARKIQVIIESHSEHILQRLLRRIAEGERSPYPEISKDDVKLYFTESIDGTSHVKPLEVNLFGSIENWPEDFFGDQFGEIAARDKAAIRRRMKQ